MTEKREAKMNTFYAAQRRNARKVFEENTFFRVRLHCYHCGHLIIHARSRKKAFFSRKRERERNDDSFFSRKFCLQRDAADSSSFVVVSICCERKVTIKTRA